MTTPVVSAGAELKKQIREQSHANRHAQENKDELSKQIVRKFMDLPEYQAAKIIRQKYADSDFIIIEGAA